MRVAHDHLTRAELDFQLSPSRSAKDFPGILLRHEAATAALDHHPDLTTQRDIPYGPAPRQRIDLTRPKGGASPLPCLAFLHGGFWQEGSKAGSGFAAATFAQAGWAHAAIGYTLAPEASLSQIVAETAAALRHLAGQAGALGLDPGRIVVAGHSAGAHLAAAILSGAAGAEAARIAAGYVLISGVYDLAPVAASYVNDLARIDAAAIAQLSPLCHVPAATAPVHLLIGADEPDAFQAQTAALRHVWSPHLPRLSFARVPGRDHFDILDDLSDPSSETFAAIRAMGG